mgnify:CR=1 FL=1
MRGDWRSRVEELLAEGRFVLDDGTPLTGEEPYRPHTFVWFHRALRDEPEVPGTIDVLHQDSCDPAELKMGQIQPLGGQAAYAAIRTSIDLAMSGRIAGVATTPINKESLQAAKIPFIGHTEMFAEHTGAREEMT